MGYQHGFFCWSKWTIWGLSLWWKDLLSIQILSSSINAIDTCVLDLSTGSKVHITWMYGLPRAENKCTFWDNHTKAFSVNGLPWMCAGDFNELMWPYEKSGGRDWDIN